MFCCEFLDTTNNFWPVCFDLISSSSFVFKVCFEFGWDNKWAGIDEINELNEGGPSFELGRDNKGDGVDLLEFNEGEPSIENCDNKGDGIDELEFNEGGPSIENRDIKGDGIDEFNDGPSIEITSKSFTFLGPKEFTSESDSFSLHWLILSIWKVGVTLALSIFK